MVNKLFFAIFLSFCLSFHLDVLTIDVDTSSNSGFYIGRITSETISAHVSDMKTLLLKRSIVRNGMYIIGVVGAVYVLNSVLNYEVDKLARIDSDQLKEVVRANRVSVDGNNGSFSKIWSWAKSVPLTTGSLLKATVPYFLANTILTSAWNKVQKSLEGSSQSESLQWYYKNYTNLEKGIEVIKLNTVPFDQDSFYLNFETNQMGQKVALHAFIQEVKDAVGKKDSFLQSYLPLEVVKKYVRQSHYLDSLINDALFVEGMKKRKEFVSDDVQNDETVEQQELCRKIIHIFVGRVKEDIEKMIAFVIARYDRISLNNGILQHLIAFSNNYIDHVERLLAMSSEELKVASFEKRGLFTKTFEFNKQFDDCFKTLNSYLAWD